MPKLTIDGTELEVAPGTSVLQACEQLGIEIPRFCYHDKLSVPANCRMCLVEVEKAPKPVASCAMPAQDGMVVHTGSPLVQKARKGVMEMLLINHPLDCPICDQGGECDLQDQAVAYGFDRSRFFEQKRAVQDKELGPLVKTVMTRCIHCTRCVRFADEIAGVPQLGATGRGEHVEIGTYVEQAVATELSGNLIDVCPVGALTSKPYEFTARPWELRKVETIDVHDAVGCNIRLDVRGNEVMRVQPRLNEAVNEEWINDKTRFAYDGLKRQRLDSPYVRVNGKLQPASWQEAFAAIAARVKNTSPNRMGVLVGDLVDMEGAFALKQLCSKLGITNLDCRVDGAEYDVHAPVGYLFNSTIAGIEQADVILLVGTNPRHEASLVNARIRKRWRRGDVKIALVGPQVDLTYKYEHLGNTPLVLEQIARGVHPFSDSLKAAQRPMIIVGAGALAREDGAAIHSAARKIAEQHAMVRPDWNGFNVLQLAAGRTGALALGCVPAQGGMATRAMIHAAQSGALDVMYLHGVDNFTRADLGKAFVVYQGHHGDAGASAADVILPGLAYSEKSATYMNTEGRVQQTRAATSALGAAREDWKIIRALAEQLGVTLEFDTLAQLRRAMVTALPAAAAMGEMQAQAWLPFGVEGQALSARDIVYAVTLQNFYQTNVIARASETMAACTAEFSRASLTGAAA